MRTSGHRIPSPSLGGEREISSLTVVPAATRRLLIGWLSLALASLVVAGIFAAIAAFARTPVVHTLFSPNAFRLALTSHVTFAFTVWFVTFAGVLWIYVAWRSNYPLGVGASWAALSLAALGSAAMAVPAFLASGQPYLNDYLPVIDQPFFWAGLVLVAAGLSLEAAAYLAAALQGERRARRQGAAAGSPEGLAMAAGAVAMLLAVAATVLAFWRLDPALPFGYSLRALVWGGGHILQYLHVTGMATGWIVAISVALVTVFPARRVLRILLWVLLPFMAAATASYLVWRPEELLINHLITILTFGGLGAAGVPVFFMAASAVVAAGRPLPWASPLFGGTVVSFALYAIGGVMGLIGFTQDTRVPAHYHGMVGAVTLAYMGLTPMLLEICGRRPWSARLTRWQPYLYGIGLLGIMIGMHWAGGHGAPRKTFGFTWATAQAILGMNIMGAGSVLAILGGLAFVLNMGIPLVTRRRQC
ncbi:MAG: cbb3-type cytochrome c oxidase subunit I [Candidatus Rokubacteria bacterium]|nr:cbb3-type cytochrome c oxidase subunit I [Candidatus Rokubacteria bacterium]